MYYFIKIKLLFLGLDTVKKVAESKLLSRNSFFVYIFIVTC